MTPGIVAVLFVASALVATGVAAIAWRRDLAAGLAGVPLVFAGAGVGFAGVARFAAHSGEPLIGQELAVLLAVVALAAVAIGVGFAGRENPR